MALNKANKALFRAKYGDKLYDAMILAENVIVTEDGGSEVSLADKLVALLTAINGKATEADITSAIEALNISQYATTTALNTVDGKANTLIGSDNGKSVRVIAGEVLASAGKLERKKVASVSDIDPTAEDAEKYIYMVPKGTAKSGDKYDEYMVIDGAVEKVGDWEVDLADYVTKVSGAKAGDVAVFKADGSIEDTNIKASDITAAKTVTDKLADNADAIGGITAEKIAAWDAKQNALTFDSTPTKNSTNPVTSGGVKDALDLAAQTVSTHTSDTTVHITADERTA